jgi:FkbM family methyltransferase
VSQIEPPFGTYVLPRPFEAFRRAAVTFPRNRVGRWAASLVRRVCVAGRSAPFDVGIFPGINARLYPATNRCEKRVFAAPQFFDLTERQALSKAVEASGSDEFVFLDLGANVGFYSLWVVSEGRRLGRKVKALAVEPDDVTRARLETNISASEAAGLVVPAACGVGGTSGTARMLRDDRNRGANRIDLEADNNDGSGLFEVLTIAELCDRFDIRRVDAIKIDVEGHDFAALSALFESGRQDLYPSTIIAEVGRTDQDPPLAKLCEANGYSRAGRARLNIIMQRSQA